MSSPLAGSVRWAVVPYAPAAPFRLYAGPDYEPIEAPLDRLFADGRAGGDGEYTFLTTGKARPVLILSDPPERLHREITALRLARFSKLSAPEQEAVRQQRDPDLFHLPPSRFDLPEENAAIVSALVHIDLSAVEQRSCGQLNAEEMRVLGERIINFYGFDTHLLFEAYLRELASRRRKA